LKVVPVSGSNRKIFTWWLIIAMVVAYWKAIMLSAC
jgi:hypothetical protein